jgi:hypothetical protein
MRRDAPRPDALRRRDRHRLRAGAPALRLEAYPGCPCAADAVAAGGRRARLLRVCRPDRDRLRQGDAPCGRSWLRAAADRVGSGRGYRQHRVRSRSRADAGDDAERRNTRDRPRLYRLRGRALAGSGISGGGPGRARQRRAVGFCGQRRAEPHPGPAARAADGRPRIAQRDLSRCRPVGRRIAGGPDAAAAAAGFLRLALGGLTANPSS